VSHDGFMAGAGQSTDTSKSGAIGCIAILLFLAILPIIHYLIGIFALILAIAVAPLCMHLVNLIEARDRLKQQLLGGYFTSEGICGIVDDIAIQWHTLIPILVFQSTIHSLQKGDNNTKQVIQKIETTGLQKNSNQLRLVNTVASRLSIELHSDLSPEAKSIDLLFRCLKTIRVGRAKLEKLDKNIGEYSISLTRCKGNPLLEPSMDNIKRLLGDAKELRQESSQRIAELNAKIDSIEEFLLLPSAVRNSISTGDTNDDCFLLEAFDDEFKELIELTETMDALTDGRLA